VHTQQIAIGKELLDILGLPFEDQAYLSITLHVDYTMKVPTRVIIERALRAHEAEEISRRLSGRNAT